MPASREDGGSGRSTGTTRPSGRASSSTPWRGAGRAGQGRPAATAREPRTVVLFEAPTRVAATLAELTDGCGPDRRVALARELTKLHEEVWRGTLGGARQRFGE